VWLIPCQDEDAEARWLVDRLAARDCGTAQLVTASELVHGAIWRHQVTRTGTRTTCRLGDGRLLDSDAVSGVLNRILWVSADGYLGAGARDREYATTELQALVLSWLEGFGQRVVNRPTPPGAGAPWRHDCEWRARALHAGVRIVPYVSGEGEPPPVQVALLVIDGQAIEAEDPAAAAEPRVDPARLAAALELDLFEAGFSIAGDGAWELATVDSVPALSGAGEAGVAAVARALAARSEVPH
jgi:hypothetical protein